MKFEMILNLCGDRVNYSNNDFEIESLNLEDENIKNKLSDILTMAMSNVQDPDVRGKSPDIFIHRLLEGRFGDIERTEIIIGRKKKETIGELILVPRGTEHGHIYSFGVYEQYRGCGIGKKLMSRFLKHLHELGYHKVTLDVHSENVPALRLYEKMGFQVK